MEATPDETGGLLGRVVDDATGEPLRFANVVLLGTTMGASTGADGTCRFRSVPAGTYTVRASHVGRFTETLENLHVTAGDTAVVDFRMRVRCVYKRGPSRRFEEFLKVADDPDERIRVVLELVPPVELEWHDRTMDEIDVTLVDSTGKVLHLASKPASVALQRQRLVVLPRLHVRQNTPAAGAMGVRWPPGTGTRPVPCGSCEEMALLDVLQRWADRHVPQALQDSLARVAFDSAMPLPERQRQLRDWGRDGWNALRLVRFVRSIQPPDASR